MERDAYAGRTLCVLAMITLLFAAVACKKSDDTASGDDGDDGNTTGNLGEDEDDETPRDAGGTGSEVEDPRMHDGAVQVREEPEDACTSVNAAGSSYFFCPSVLPYTMAVGSCWAAGSTLVTINDAAENQALVDEMTEDEYWIGYTDAGEEDSWAWAEGSEGSTYENWDDEQPGIDDFAFIKRETGRWSTSTDAPRPYICELWR